MEQLHPLLTFLAGTTLVVIGSFVLASERKLKKKRRELDEIKRKRTGDSDTSTAGQYSEIQSPQAIGKNNPTSQEISVASSRLEESQGTLDGGHNDRRLLLSAQSENQQLKEKIENLKVRLKTGEDELATSTKRIHEAFDSNTKLQIEITGLKQQLAEKDEALEGLRNQAADAARLQSENQEFRTENQRLLEENATFRGQLQIHEEKLNGMASQHQAAVERQTNLQTRLAESEQQTVELTAKNQQLQEDVDGISRKLAAAEQSLEEFQLLRDQAQSDNRRLLEAHQQLKQEFEMMRERLETLQSQRDEFAKRNQEAAESNEKLQMELSDHRQTAIKERQEAERRAQEEQENHRIQLDARENQLQESVRRYQETADRCARLEAEVSDYRQQLEQSQSNSREMETALAKQKANIESHEMRHQEQQRKLEALTGDLDRGLSERKSQAEALEQSHERLRETERIGQELANENRRLGEEIARWQERFAASEEKQAQVSMLRQQLDALQAEHARVIGQNRQLQEKLAASDEARGVSSPVESDSTGATMLQSKIHTVEGSVSDLTGSGEAGGHLLGSNVSEPKPHLAMDAKTSQKTRISIVRYRHLRAVLAGVVVLVIVGAVAMKIPRAKAPNFETPAALVPEATTVEQVAEPGAKPPIKASPRLRGAFRTVRPTQVFSGPSEYSTLIGNIGEGIKLNVVDSRDGWLEIRSKHGRPPGFIRQEAAVMIGSN